MPTAAGESAYKCMNKNYYNAVYNRNAWFDRPTGALMKGYCAGALNILPALTSSLALIGVISSY